MMSYICLNISVFYCIIYLVDFLNEAYTTALHLLSIVSYSLGDSDLFDF